MTPFSKPTRSVDKVHPPLLELLGLQTYFATDEGTARAVDGVSFALAPGETLGLVGESGCGKSVTALSIMGLVPPPGRVVGGEVRFRGEDLRTGSQEALRRLRGREIAMVFQEPMSALNPVLTIGTQLLEAIELHTDLDGVAARARAIELLERVGFPGAAQRLGDYPYQLSGGMRQRVVIAMAMSCDPALLIADEPTTALDVTIQAQILDVLRQLQAEQAMGLLLITHDLGVVAQLADRVAVMYAGKIVELARTEELFSSPSHPYTQGLLASLPGHTRRGERLETIPGMVPSATHLPDGCRFRMRCEFSSDTCAATQPTLEVAPQSDTESDVSDHWVACHHPAEGRRS